LSYCSCKGWFSIRHDHCHTKLAEPASDRRRFAAVGHSLSWLVRPFGKMVELAGSLSEELAQWDRIVVACCKLAEAGCSFAVGVDCSFVAAADHKFVAEVVRSFAVAFDCSFLVWVARSFAV